MHVPVCVRVLINVLLCLANLGAVLVLVLVAAVAVAVAVAVVA